MRDNKHRGIVNMRDNKHRGIVNVLRRRPPNHRGKTATRLLPSREQSNAST